MGKLRKRFDRRFVDRDRHSVTPEDRQALVVFATGFLGRSENEGIEFDEQVRSAVTLATTGVEASGLGILAKAVADHDVPISLEELTTFARLARSVDLHEDQWAFVGASVRR